MANLTNEEALSLLRDGMYGGQDAVTLDYVDVLEIYNTFKELVWEHKRTVAELTMCRGDRVRDYEDRLKTVTSYHAALRQYACSCDEPCDAETLNADYCGWKAKQMIGG